MHGIEGLIVRVETDSYPGTPSLMLIGLADRSLSGGGALHWQRRHRPRGELRL
jgi:hypothetical protein